MSKNDNDQLLSFESASVSNSRDLSSIKGLLNTLAYFAIPILFLIGLLLFLNGNSFGVFVMGGTVAFIFLYLFYIGVRINLEFERSVIFRFGKIVGSKGGGIIWIIPFIDKRVQFDTRVRTVDIEEQDAITRDGVAIKVNAVLYYHIEKPEKTAASIMNFHDATIQTALTTLRDIIGQHDLDQVLSDRGKLNKEMEEIVDRETEPWGIQIDSIKTKDVEIPAEIINSMSRSAQAKREKDARITEVDAEVQVIEKLAEIARSTDSNLDILELRRLFMLHAVGMDGRNSSTFIVVPTEMFPQKG